MEDTLITLMDECLGRRMEEGGTLTGTRIPKETVYETPFRRSFVSRTHMSPQRMNNNVHGYLSPVFPKLDGMIVGAH
jgi:hypothetical protein